MFESHLYGIETSHDFGCYTQIDLCLNRTSMELKPV